VRIASGVTRRWKRLEVAMRLVAGAAILLTAAACGGDSGPAPEPTQLAFQVQPSATVAGQPITPAVQVGLRDASGSAVVGTNAVTLGITSNATGAALIGTATVDAVNGVATFSDLRVDKAGTNLVLRATADGLAGAMSATFDVSPAPGVAATILPVAGEGQSERVGQPVATAPAVQITDGLGDPVAGVPVTFTVSAGKGSADGVDQTTDATGVATVGQWTLGTTAGVNTLIAGSSALPGSTVRFTATGVAGPADALLRISEDNQVARISSAVADAPSVQVTDAFGNPVADVAVTFVPGPGGGSVSGGSPVTGSDGLATVGSWMLGGTAGPYTLAATSDGLDGSPVVFHAIAGLFSGAVTVELHNNFFLSVQNGTGANPDLFGSVAIDTVAAGGTVTWVWKGQGHNVTSEGNAAFAASPTQNAPFTFGPIKFNTPGTYLYHCTVHSQVVFDLGRVGMRGEIVVR
jgi:adhesin/invasin